MLESPGFRLKPGNAGQHFYAQGGFHVPGIPERAIHEFPDDGQPGPEKNPQGQTGKQNHRDIGVYRLFGDPRGVDEPEGVAQDILRRICEAAYSASVDLAVERGAFPLFDRDAYLGGRFVQRLPPAIRDRIARQGIRNSHLLATAPAGTISLLAGNVLSGIEPIFAMQAERRVLGADGQYHRHAVEDFAWRLWRSRHPGEALPPGLVEATGIDATAHLEMQAALQPWVDNAISKTINVRRDIPFEDFAGLYELAHSRGLKGCTVFRPNPVRGQILASVTAERGRCCDLEREADRDDPLRLAQGLSPGDGGARQPPAHR